MADSPISGLPAVTLPLIGTEEAPVVQDGITKKATAAELLAGAATAAQGVKADTALQPGGPLATPSSGTLTSCTGLPLDTGVTGLLPVHHGGTGTITPSLVAGTNVSIAGTWPNQTISATAGGGGVLAVTGTTPIVSSGGPTPAISITPASGSAAGSMSQADFTKLAAITGTNTGDNSPNSLYSGLVSNATHTGDATGSVALTLATVNSNVGSFGSATAAPNFTVNAKGLITAAGSTTVTPAIGSVTGLGTGVATALAINTGSAGAPVLFGGAGGTPSSLTLTNATGLPLVAGTTGLLSVARGGTGTATPSLVEGTNVTITGSWPNQTINASGAGGSLTVQDEGSTLSAAVTTLNFTGAGVTATGTTTVTVNVPAGSGGNVSNSGTPTSGQAAEWVTATTVQGVAVTGTGSYVKGTAPTITLPNATGLPLATGITGLGTGIATSLAANVGSAGAPVLFNGAGGTPSSLTLTNATGLSLATGVTGVLPSGNGGNATHTGDATGATALTLATVNSNVGSFGSATAMTIFTVNGKGLITAASATPVTPPWSSITSTPTTRAGYGITDAAANGDIGSSGITLSGPGIAGRSAAGSGSATLITLGTNLSFTGNVLNAAGGGGGGTPGGVTTEAQFNNAGAFDGASGLIIDTATKRIARATFINVTTPATPAEGFTLYALNGTGAFSWIGANGFTRTFDATGITANRTWTPPDRSGAVALDDFLHGTITQASPTNLDCTALAGSIRTITLTGNLTFTASNYAVGKTFGIRLIAGAANRTMAWPSGWVGLGVGLPTLLVANKTARFTVECYGSAATDVVVGYSVQP